MKRITITWLNGKSSKINIKFILLNLLILSILLTAFIKADLGKEPKEEVGGTIIKTQNTTFKEIANSSGSFFGKSISLNKDILIISSSEFRANWFPTNHPLKDYKNLTITFQIENTKLNQNISLRATGLVPRNYGGEFDINFSNPKLVTIPFGLNWEISNNFIATETVYNQTKEVITEENKTETVQDKLITIKEKLYSSYTPIDISKTSLLTNFKDGYLDPTVSACGDLTTENGVYDLTQNVNTTGTCFNIVANNITLDCHGYIVNYSSGGAVGYGVNVTNWNMSTIKNCVITQGIYANDRYGTIFSRSFNSILDNCTLTSISSLAYPIVTSSGTTNLTVSNNNCSGAAVCYQNADNSVRYITIKNNLFQAAAGGISTRGHYYNITNNTIITSQIVGAEQYGILFFQSYYNSVTFNQINTSTGRAIVLTGTLIDDYNHIIDETNLAEGLPINYTFNKANLIFDGMNNQYGQLLFGFCSNITISNSNISKDGLFIHNSTQFNVFNNNINTGNGWGIYLTYVTYSNFTNNYLNITPITSSPFFKTFYSGTSRNNLIFNNTFNTKMPGLYFDSSNYNLIDSNDITITPGNSYGIQIVGGLGLNISYNTITTNGSNGIHITSGTSNSVIEGNTVTSNGGTQVSAMYLSAIRNNQFIKNTLFQNAAYAGIGIDSPNNNLTFSGMNILTTSPTATAYPLYQVSNGQNYNFTFSDSILNSSRGIEFYLRTVQSSSTMNFTNVTKSDGITPINISWMNNSNGTLNMHWYLDVNVSNGTTPIANANVSITDVNGLGDFSALTDINGAVRDTLLEYVRNGTSGLNTTYFSNYTVNVNLTGYTNVTTFINMSGNQVLNIILNEIVDAIPPYFITIPSNLTVTYTQAIDSGEFIFNDSIGKGNLSINYTSLFNVTNNHIINGTKIAVGIYEINVTINDTSGNINSTIYRITVNKATSIGNLTINGTDGDYTMNAGYANITGRLTVPTGASINLTRNGTTFQSGTTPLQNISSWSLGTYNISVIFIGNENYTSFQEDHNLIVAVTTPATVEDVRGGLFGVGSAPEALQLDSQATNATTIHETETKGKIDKELLFVVNIILFLVLVVTVGGYNLKNNKKQKKPHYETPKDNLD